MSQSFASNRVHALREGLHAMRRDVLNGPSVQRAEQSGKASKNIKLKGGGQRKAKRTHRRSPNIHPPRKMKLTRRRCSQNNRQRRYRASQLVALETRIFNALRGHTFKKRLK